MNTDELDRLADDIDKDRIIQGSVYCAECGYNLRMLHYVGVCPECGKAYNARPLKMKGIFLPHHLEFPAGDVFASLVLGAAAVVLIVTGVNPFRSGQVFLGVFLAITALAYLRQCITKVARFFHFHRIVRRIMEQSDDLED